MDNLQFQDFNLGSGESSTNPASTEFRPAGNIGSQAYSDGAKDSSEARGTMKKNFFSFEYYQQYFDVDTDQVYSRILHSMVPRFGSNFITDHIQPIPDLYGPFWICVTLVFMTAICGNLAKYIETSGSMSETYGSDFRLVTGASMLIACYVILIPFALYSLFWYRKSELQYSYLELFCAYGYSLSIFVPVSILWVINIQWFRWLLIIVSVLFSGAVLVNSIWPALKTDRNRLLSFGVIFGVLALHCLLAVAFKEYYFDVSHSKGAAPVTVASPSVANPSALGPSGPGSVEASIKLPQAVFGSNVSSATVAPKNIGESNESKKEKKEEPKEKGNPGQDKAKEKGGSAPTDTSKASTAEGSKGKVE